jgi:hypothetical protein
MNRLVLLVVALAIVAFWLHSLYEALQLERASAPKDLRVGRASYEILLARSLERDPVQYYTILQNGRKAGHSFTEIKRVNTRYHITNETRFTPQILVPILTQAESEILIGPDFQIEHFLCKVQLAGSQVRAQFKGEAVGADLVVTYWLPFGEAQTTRLSRDLTLFNGLSPFVGVPQLDVGEEWYIQGLDVSMLGGTGLSAASFRPKIMTAKVLRKETIPWDGKPTEAFVAAIQEDPTDALKRRSQAWIAADGRILKEEHRILDWTFTFRREPVQTRPGWRPFQ